MNRWLRELNNRAERWMHGRYGGDELSGLIILACAILSILSLVRELRFLCYIALLLIVWVIIRCCSKNIAGRKKELALYQKTKKKCADTLRLYEAMWLDRKQFCYFTCKKCKKVFRVPKEKGKTEITCPHCGNTATKRT